MIKKYVFLIFLCWPFVSMAVDTSAIRKAPTISEAISAAKEALSKLNLQGSQKIQAEQLLASAIDDIKRKSDAKETPENGGDEYCPATDNRLKSINDKTKIGDECSSTNIAAGEVVWHKQLVKGKKVCTCVAYACNDGFHSEKGGCSKDEVKKPNCPRQEYDNVPDIKTGNDALKFCETKGGKQCKTINAVKNFNKINSKVLCNANPEELGIAKQQMADTKLKYYNCGLDAKQLPKDIKCTFVTDFKSYKVTPMEATGLMKEWVLKKHNDDIKCDTKSHRKGKMQNQTVSNNYNYAPGAGGYAMTGQAINNLVATDQEEHYRQCISTKNPKQFYEFEFKDLDAGNNGSWGAVCTIWGLKSGTHLCKNASKAQCDEISAAVDRSFYPGGSAELNGTDCVVKEHSAAKSASFTFINKLKGNAVLKDDLRSVGNSNPLHFYDKKLEVSANSDIYRNIINYIFVELGLPVKPFRCGASFVDNVPYYKITHQQFDAIEAKYNQCKSDCNTIKGLGALEAQRTCRESCDVQWKNGIGSDVSGDLLVCEYDGQPVDFLFSKLDVIWDRKSTGGYQGLHCLREGGSFTGKSCTLANEQQCKDFNAKFKEQYPNSQGMDWDPSIGEHGACVLKDAKFVGQVQKVAEVSGMVALTLVTSVAGGPVVWALSVVESAALVTEAVTEEKINKWAESFLADAANCKNNNSNCANAVMKRHIARIIEGSNQFDETQNKQIAKQIERLIGMLDEKTLTQIVDKGEASGYIGEERDPDLEKSIRDYYGTQLTTAEKALLVTKKTATVLTFATLIGGGIMAGLRQSFKKGWVHIDKVKQAHWVDLKILRESDVAADVFAMSKTGKKAAAKAGTIASAATDVTTDATKADDAAKGTTKTFDNVVVSDTKLANVASAEDQRNFDKVLQNVKDQVNGKIKGKELTVDNVEDGVIKRGNYTEAQMKKRLQNYDEYKKTHHISTQDRYKTVETSEIGADGKPVMKYTAKRLKEHDAIITQILKEINDPFPANGEKPVFVMLGGRGGSGKSALDGLAYNKKNALVVDPDAIKEMLSEYRELVQKHSKYAGLNAWEVHEESSDIAARLLEIGRERGMNVVLDATMSNAVSAEKKIIPFKQAGYRIEGAFMQMPPYEAAVKAVERGLKADGRFVPPDILLKNTNNEENFQKITPLFDKWKMYGNNFFENGNKVYVISSSK